MAKQQDERLVWFARGGGIKQCGPFDSQLEAVNAMRLAKDPDSFPEDIFVWPAVEKEDHGRERDS